MDTEKLHSFCDINDNTQKFQFGKYGLLLQAIIWILHLFQKQVYNLNLFNPQIYIDIPGEYRRITKHFREDKNKNKEKDATTCRII